MHPPLPAEGVRLARAISLPVPPRRPPPVTSCRNKAGTSGSGDATRPPGRTPCSRVSTLPRLRHSPALPTAAARIRIPAQRVRM
jgi:hypothetical protein